MQTKITFVYTENQIQPLKIKVYKFHKITIITAQPCTIFLQLGQQLIMIKKKNQSIILLPSLGQQLRVFF